MATRGEMIKGLKAHAATLPNARDKAHRCLFCGAVEERWHETKTEAGAVRQFLRCDGCGHEQTLHIVWSK
jgi:transcription elongation factor Elf1